MDPVTAFAIMGGVSSLAEGAGQQAEAMDRAAREDAEARLAETQALQRDAQRRDELSRYLSSVRAVRAGNGLSSTSPSALLWERHATSVMDRDRRREQADLKQRAANFRSSAEAYRRRGRFSLITGALKAGKSFYQASVN